MISKLLLFIWLPLQLISEHNKQPNVSIEVSNIKDDDGQLVVSIYNEANQFPDNPIKIINIPKHGKDRLISYQLYLPEDNYSIIVLDDINSNGKMDYRFGIYPKEAFGFSNNTKVSGLKSPSFEDCLFKVEKDEMAKMAIDLNKI